MKYKKISAIAAILLVMANTITPALALDELAPASQAAVSETGNASASVKTPVTNEDTAKTVVVTATKTKKNIIEVPANVTVITAEDIRKNGYQNIVHILQSVPGMILMDNNKGEAGLFGARVPAQFGGNSQMKVLVDGTEVNITSIGVDVKQIEKVEVVRGPNSALYGGNTAGGVVNIFLKKGSNKEKVKITAQGGGFNFNDQVFDIVLQDSNDKYDYNISADSSYTSGFSQSNSAVQSNKYTGKFNYYLDESSSMYVNFDYHAFPFKQFAGMQTRAQYETNFAQTTMPWILFTSKGGRYGTGYQKNLSDTQNISFDLGYNSVDFTTLTSFSTNPGFGFRAVSTNNLLDSKLKYAQKNFLLSNSELVTGVDYGINQSDGYTNSAPNGIASTAKSSDSYSAIKPLAVYVQDDFSLSDRWKLMLGARYDNLTYDYTDRLANTQNTKVDSAITPKVSASYKLNDNSNVYVGFGQAFTPPTQTQLFKWNPNAQPNPNLVPELATNYEIGYKLGMDKFNFGATIFNTDVTNAIVIFTDPASTTIKQFRNAGSIRYTGLELSADYRFDQNWLINMGYTLEDAKYVDYKTSAVNYSGKTVQNVPVHSGVMTLQYNNDAFTASLVNKVIGGSYPGADNVAYYNGHILTDLTFSWNKPNYELFISGHNIFNNRYVAYESASGTNETITPGAPVSVMMGMTYKF